MFANEHHPVNAISVAQEAAAILTDRGLSSALVDRLMRGERRVAMAEAMCMIAVAGKPASAKVGAGRLTEYLINGALDMARERLTERFGPPPAPIVVDWAGMEGDHANGVPA